MVDVGLIAHLCARSTLCFSPTINFPDDPFSLPSLPPICSSSATPVPPLRSGKSSYFLPLYRRESRPIAIGEQRQRHASTPVGDRTEQEF